MNTVLPSRLAASLVDAHCHIDLFPDPAALVREIEQAAIHTIAVTNTPSVFFHTQALAAGCRYVHPAVGLPPELVAARAGELDRMWPLLEATRFVGEVGLDYVIKDQAVQKLQRDVFRQILDRCAAASNKILTVHSRRAAKDVIAAIGNDFPGAVILHWFSGSIGELELAISSGLYFSVNPAMTLSRSGQALIARMPQDRVLTETDGPFVKVTGEPARPQHAIHTVNYLSQVWKLPVEDVRLAVLKNFQRLYADPH
jgi:TatD DNase family protein